VLVGKPSEGGADDDGAGLLLKRSADERARDAFMQVRAAAAAAAAAVS
jgi:hypothetical protein